MRRHRLLLETTFSGIVKSSLSSLLPLKDDEAVKKTCLVVVIIAIRGLLSSLFSSFLSIFGCSLIAYLQ